MKPILTFLCCFTLLNAAFAQRFFDSADYYYYLTMDTNVTMKGYSNQLFPYHGYIEPVWPTKFSRVNDSTVQFELFKYINISHKDTLGCYFQDIPGSLGPKIEEGPETITLYNKYFEPIKLKLNTPTDSSWVAFSNDSIFVTVTRLNDEDRTIMGATHSIIRFQCSVFFNDSTPYTQSAYNLETIEIAEGLGIISTPTLSTFPYEKVITTRTLSGKINTYTQQHSGLTIFPKAETLYEIGDQFDWKRSYSGPGHEHRSGMSETIYQRDIVIQKTSNSTGTTYTYSSDHVKKKSYSSTYFPEKNYDSTIHTIDTSTYFVSSDLPSITEIVRKNETVHHASYPYSYTFNVVGNFNYNFGVAKVDTVWCLTEILFDYSFKEFYGIGIPELKNIWHPPGSNVTVELIFARKNGQTVGTPFPKNVGLSQVSPSDGSFNIYPNPAQNRVQIISLNKIKAVTLFDTKGIDIQTTTNPELFLQEIPNGLYFITVEFDNGQKVTQKLLIDHESN